MGDRGLAAALAGLARGGRGHVEDKRDRERELEDQRTKLMQAIQMAQLQARLQQEGNVQEAGLREDAAVSADTRTMAAKVAEALGGLGGQVPGRGEPGGAAAARAIAGAGGQIEGADFNQLAAALGRVSGEAGRLGLDRSESLLAEERQYDLDAQEAKDAAAMERARVGAAATLGGRARTRGSDRVLVDDPKTKTQWLLDKVTGEKFDTGIAVEEDLIVANNFLTGEITLVNKDTREAFPVMGASGSPVFRPLPSAQQSQAEAAVIQRFLTPEEVQALTFRAKSARLTVYEYAIQEGKIPADEARKALAEEEAKIRGIGAGGGAAGSGLLSAIERIEKIHAENLAMQEQMNGGS